MNKLTIIYNPKFKAANYVVNGLHLSNANKLELAITQNKIRILFYGIFLKLHLYFFAFLFRYKKQTRKALQKIDCNILFWDSCYFAEYKMLNAILKNLF